jgi:hypothetical protein
MVQYSANTPIPPNNTSGINNHFGGALTLPRFSRQRHPSATKTIIMTQTGKLRKWGAIENRKQKQTAKTLDRLASSCEIDRIGKFWLVVFKG